MNVIVCVDEIGGMAMNNRRVSRDRVLVEDVVETVGANRLLMSEYSAPLFQDCAATNLLVDDQYLTLADLEDVCFVEREALLEYAEKIEKVILYKWNRRYPATTFFDLPMEEWTLSQSVEFAGYSHEKITKEIYVK